MYIKKYIIMGLLSTLFFNSCNTPNKSPIYQTYLDGNIRSFDIINDTLFVASEDYGIVVYRIMNQDGKIYLDSLASSDIVSNPVTLDIAPQSRSLIVLDDYNHTYIGKLDFFGNNSSSLSAITCDDYQRKSTFIDYSNKPIQLITPFRHKPTQNEVDTLAWDTSFLHKIEFAEQEYDYNVYYGDCSDTLYKYLNYEIEDVFYSNEKLYLANPEDSSYSVVTLNHDTVVDSFLAIDTIAISGRPLTVKASENYMFIGLDENKGCYINLLDSDNPNISNFNIALGYDIHDIQLSDNYISLSAGYGGSLVYDLNFELVFLLEKNYSYKTIMYDDMNMIVGTKNGLYIYEIER